MNSDSDVASAPGSIVGSQTPSFIAKPALVATDHYDGEDFIDLAAAFGLEADEWQEGVVTAAMGRTAICALAAPKVALSVPRQNGKNAILEITELGQAVLMGRRVIHTAHEVKTNQKAFRRLKAYFDKKELKAHVRLIRQTNGQEAIFLDNGGSIEFISRSKNSGRGFSGDTLVFDEAQHLTDETVESLLPIISSSPEPQQIFTGTPPAPNDPYGEVFRRLHDAAHEGSDPTLLWIEWSAASETGDADIDPDDEALWLQANPALGKRITMGAVQAERSALSEAGFRRERLGLWEQERTARVLPLEDWQACADANLVDDGEPVTFGVDISPDRTCASIAACGMTTDGLPWLDVVENRRGTTEWVIPRLKAILESQEASAVLIDVLSPAGSLIDPLEAAGIRVSKIGSNIMARAAAQLYDGVMTHRIRHVDQIPLNLAAAGARKRKLGDAWAWNRSNEDTDITPLVAATMALTGRTYSKRKRPVKLKRERRKVVVW